MSIVASKGVILAPSAIEDVRKEDETKERIEKKGERESGMVRGLRDERMEFGNGLGFKVIARNIVAYLNAFIVRPVSRNKFLTFYHSIKLYKHGTV